MLAATVVAARVDADLPDPATLSALASAEPATALAAARRWIARSADPATLALAHQAAGMVRRDRGQASAARRHLDAALTSAEASGDRRIVVDVRATRGGTLAIGGRLREGLAELDRALREAHPADRAGVLMRRAFVLTQTGEPATAVDDLRRALVSARRENDVLWQARVLHQRCWTLIGLGLTERADADARAAESLFDSLGQTWMSAQARHNRAFCAALRGDVVAALRDYDDVARRYDELGVDEPMLAVDRIGALLSAGLASDAAALARGHLDTAHDRGPVLVAAATAELAAGRPEAAASYARSARRAFGTARRPAWAARATLLAVQAAYAQGGHSARLVREATRLAADPDLFAEDRPAARLLTARLAAARGDTATARDVLTGLARRVHGPALTRATTWLARAMLADLDGDDTAVRRACARGLDAVDAHRAVFGAVEVRAAASVHGAEFADLAARALLRRGSARQLLDWVERSRASSLADPAPLSGADGELARRLALAREAAASTRDSDAAARDAVRAAERAVDALRVTSAATAAARTSRPVAAALADLGAGTLVELLVVDGEVITLVGHGGRVRRRPHRATLADVRRETDFVRFALRRAGAGIGTTSRERLLAGARRLQDALFGADPGLLLSGATVVVVPPAALHDVPWAALPVFARREVVVAPSLTLWDRARAARRRRRAGTVLAAGPGLATGGAELGPIAALHPTATVLGSGRSPATATDLLAAVDGARLLHLAAHGTLRADNPMFSALHVDGGPLFVHDVERLERAPREVVLASCNSGLGADVGADQLLGLASAFLRAGSAAVLTSTVAVGDAACVPFALAVHRGLADGAPLPRATMSARVDALDHGDPLAVATALAFTVWGS